MNPIDPKAARTLLITDDTAAFVTSDDPALSPAIRKAVARVEAGGAGAGPVLERHKAWNTPPAYLVTDAPLPATAIVQVVRDPQAMHPRIIVLPATGITDDALHLGIGRLVTDEMKVAEATGRRVISVFSDDTYIIEQDGEVVASGEFFLGREAARTRGQKGRDSEDILERVRNAPTTTVSEIAGRLYLPPHA